MSLTKRKNNKNLAVNITKRAGGALVLCAFLASAAIPAAVDPKSRQITLGFDTVLADSSQNNQLVLKESRDIKSKWAKASQEYEKPHTVMQAVLTAYTSTVDQCDDTPFIAASGKRVYDGMIAANGLPFGTRIKIPSLFGDKIFTVDDRMNARYGLGHMDIWMDAPRSQALQFGVRVAQVEIYYPVYHLTMNY